MAWSQTKDDLLLRCLMLEEDIEANVDRLTCFKKLVWQCCLGVGLCGDYGVAIVSGD